MAIKCHSGFVHYNMFHNHHCHGGGNNYGSIFNITNNCGGGCGGGFWGGFGAGLGLGFGNLLGGLFGGFMGGMGNMFGGFGMGNMFGMGGFGGFGGWGNGLAGLLGGGAAGGADRDYSEYSSRRSRTSSSCDCGCKNDKTKDVDPTDADCKKIADFQEEINKLEQPISEEKYNDLKSRITAARTESEKDTKNKDANLKSYDELLEDLDGAKAGKSVVNPVNKPVVKSDDIIEGVTEEDLKKLKDVGLDNDAIKQAIKTGLPIDTIVNYIKAGLKPEDLQTIKDVGAEIVQIAGGKNALTLPATLSLDSLAKLKAISDKRNIAVAVANNPKAEVDNWIAGKLDNIEEKDGKLSYTVDCDNVGAYGYKYQVKQLADNKWSIDVHKDSFSKMEEDGNGHREQTDYQLIGKKLYKEGSTVVSQWY